MGVWDKDYFYLNTYCIDWKFTKFRTMKLSPAQGFLNVISRPHLIQVFPSKSPSWHIPPHLMPLYVYLDLASVLLYIHNLSTIFYLCKTRKRSLKINRNSHRLELETPPKDYTLAHWSTQYENQFTLSFFYSGKKNKQKHRFP